MSVALLGSVANMLVSNRINHGFSVTKTILIFFATVLFSLSAHCETIPAASSTYTALFQPWRNSVGMLAYTGATPTDACEAVRAPYLGADSSLVGVTKVSDTQYTCNFLFHGSPHNSIYVVSSKYCNSGDTLNSSTGICTNSLTCPTGQNWTLSGSNCTRPDCTAPDVRDPNTGLCTAPPDPCVGKEAQAPVTSWYPSTVGAPSLESSKYCDSGCTAALNPSPTGTSYANKQMRWQQYQLVQLGYSCAAGLPSTPSISPPDKQPVEPPKKTPCSPNEGVLTSSSGSVNCVPSGVPGASTPVVTNSKDVQVHPDGSKKTTERITTRDPATGAESKDEVITVSPKPDGTPGTAGTPGTTNGKTEQSTNNGGDPTKPSDSDFCAKNPNLQVCKGGMNEEATQKEVRDKLKEINDSLNPKDPADVTALDAKKTEYDAKADELKAVIDAQGTKGQSDEGFMSWAMIPEIPASSCTPFSGQISGKTIELDWCDKINMIRDIAGYAFYVLTAFGLFRIFSNSTGATS